MTTLLIALFFAAIVCGGTLLYMKQTDTFSAKNLAIWTLAAFAGVWFIWFATEILPDLGSK